MCSIDNLLSFAGGVGCGLGIALALAPKSGNEMRSLIANGARGCKDQVQRQATERLHKGQDQLQRHSTGLKQAVKACFQTYQSNVA